MSSSSNHLSLMKMAIKHLAIFLFSIILFSATASLGSQDPELRQCKQQCKQQQQYDRRQSEQCKQRCEQYYREKQRREEGGGRGGELNPESPEARLKECVRSCDRREDEEQRSQCRRECQGRYRREREEGGRGDDADRDEEEGQREGHPFVFEDQHFTTIAKTQHGQIRFLQKFTERSKLFRGIENFRVAILEADPQTFVVPAHFDADQLFFVAKGRGTISLVRQDKRESFNFRCGDIFRIPAGLTAYLINRDNNEKLVLVKLIRTISVPGQFETFFAAGGEEPESFFKAFSDEILEAAFNTKRDRFQRVFGQQRQGSILKASQEQIRAMSQHEEGGIWPFGGEAKGPFNLFHGRPSQSNDYGELYEANFRQFKQLEDLDVALSFANITQGSMTAPFYNSRATKISVVLEGDGYFEMACPHLSPWESDPQGRQRPAGRTGGGSYERVSGRLRRGTVVVVPAGHPFVTVASKNQNLKVLCFEINARGNQKFPLAGRRNIINQLEREAKELAFQAPARDVEEVFKSQKEEFFFKGPSQRQEGHAEA